MILSPSSTALPHLTCTQCTLSLSLSLKEERFFKSLIKDQKKLIKDQLQNLNKTKMNKENKK